MVKFFTTPAALLSRLGVMLFLAISTIAASREAWADDLVAATLPQSRSAVVGNTVTVFATVINTSGRALSGCTVSLTGFPVTVSFATTDPVTNAINGPTNVPFPLGVGASQTLVLGLTPNAAMPAQNLPFLFSCSGANPAASVIGVNTVTLSSAFSSVPDVVALVATPSDDGISHINGVGANQVFAVATVNLGATSAITAIADTGSIPLPVTLTICQTNPQTGVCLSPPSASVTTTIAENATPTFGIFLVSTGAIPFLPAIDRVFVHFTDPSGTVRGATSVALTDGASLPPSGIFIGTLTVSTGAAAGVTDGLQFLVAEDGEVRGITTESGATSAIFEAQAAISSGGSFTAQGEAAANTAHGFVLGNGAATSPLSVTGLITPLNSINGNYAISGSGGTLAASFDSALYERAIPLSIFAGTWNVHDINGNLAGTLVAQANGAFTATTDGCQLSGTFTPIDPSLNAFHIVLTASNCANAGTYSGLGIFDDTQTTNDTILFVLSSPSLILFNEITRF